MTTLSASQARSQFGRLLRRAARRKQRVVLTSRGKEMAAMVPMEDLRLIERLAEEEEDRIDREEARKAKWEPGPNGKWEDLRKELGL
ncbi:MAG: type II toxin-antitoxin system prevent-host-death family antitoxin [Planctomycetota bacterium]|nr:type II toxin-antitoxin system prevent-host-death family antitoxin [Planctomycetota bacterium]